MRAILAAIALAVTPLPHTLRLTGTVQSTAALVVERDGSHVVAIGTVTGCPWAGSWRDEWLADGAVMVALGPDGPSLDVLGQPRALLAGGP